MSWFFGSSSFLLFILVPYNINVKRWAHSVSSVFRTAGDTVYVAYGDRKASLWERRDYCRYLLQCICVWCVGLMGIKILFNFWWYQRSFTDSYICCLLCRDGSWYTLTYHLVACVARVCDSLRGWWLKLNRKMASLISSMESMSMTPSSLSLVEKMPVSVSLILPVLSPFRPYPLTPSWVLHNA